MESVNSPPPAASQSQATATSCMAEAQNHRARSHNAGGAGLLETACNELHKRVKKVFASLKAAESSAPDRRAGFCRWAGQTIGRLEQRWLVSAP